MSDKKFMRIAIILAAVLEAIGFIPLILSKLHH